MYMHGVPKGRKLVGHHAIALQPVHVEGHHARPLLQEALVGQLVGLDTPSKDIVAEAHELVAWGIDTRSVSCHG
jgi:hypothetical protein